MPVAVQKSIIAHAVLADAESSYGAGGALTGADHALLIEEPAVITPGYIFDGSRSPEVGQGGRYPNAQPGGREAAGFVIPVLARGANAAYSATVTPQDIHTLLLISGHEATLDATASAETYTYVPETHADASGYDSAVIEAYYQGEVITIKGVYATLNFEIDGPSFMRVEAECSGFIDTDPADSTVPALTIANHQPPKAEGLTFNIGDYTAPRVRSISFSQNRGVGNRADVNAVDGHAGFAPGRRDPMLEVTVEASPLEASPFHGTTGIDPYQLREQATSLASSFQIGATQYNQLTFTAPQTQVIEVSKEDENAVALWTLTMALNQSAPGADDEYSLLLD